MVYFDRNMVVTHTDNEEILIERTDNKNRERPDAQNRHGGNFGAYSNLGLYDLRDFEYMAWNYRAYKNGLKFKSKEVMIIQMFNENFSYLPTPEEILRGIILA